MPIFPVDITIDPGGDFIYTTCPYVVNGVIQDFTGRTARLVIFKNVYDVSPFLSLTNSVTANGFLTPNGVLGTVGINITALATLALIPYIGPLQYTLYVDDPHPVVQVNVTAGGSGYVTAPTISFTGGGGSNAAAYATLSSGAVQQVLLTDPGYGYTSAPAVVFSSGSATATAIVEAIQTLSLQGGNIFLNTAQVTE